MQQTKIKPKAIRIEDGQSQPDYLSSGCHITYLSNEERVGGIGLFNMLPGKQTSTFSMETSDDGMADEYYGECHEYYYVLIGEFTMYWGEDVSEIHKGTANKIKLKPGDLGYWTPGWKYSVKNTGKVPGTFFWGITRPPGGIKRRAITEVPQWLLEKSK